MTSIVFRNARIVDGSGAAPFAGDVRVEGQRIAEIAPAGRAPARPDAQVIECEGATLMPGLIEPHSHLSFVDQSTPLAFHTIPVEEHLLLTLKQQVLPRLSVRMVEKNSSCRTGATHIRPKVIAEALVPLPG